MHIIIDLQGIITIIYYRCFGIKEGGAVIQIGQYANAGNNLVRPSLPCCTGLSENFLYVLRRQGPAVRLNLILPRFSQYWLG